MKTDLRTALLSVLLVDAPLRALWPTDQLVTLAQLYPDRTPPAALSALDLSAGCIPAWYRAVPRTRHHMPYLNFLFTLKEGDILGLNMGSLLIDVWDYAPNADRADAIVQRLRGLLHHRGLDVYPATVAARVFYRSDDEVKTGTENVWRNSLAFDVRAMDAGTLATMLTRDGG